MRYFQKQSPNVFCKKCVLKNFANFTGKHMFKSLFKKVAGLQACMFIKKRLQHRCFPVNIAKLSRTPILKYIFCIFEILTTNNLIFILAKNFIFNFRIYKILCILQLHQIYVSFSVFLASNFQHFSQNFQCLVLQQYNRLNTFSQCQKFILIDNTQNLSSGFIQRQR